MLLRLHAIMVVEIIIIVAITEDVFVEMVATEVNGVLTTDVGLTEDGKLHAFLTGDTADVVLAKFFGMVVVAILIAVRTTLTDGNHSGVGTIDLNIELQQHLVGT